MLKATVSVAVVLLFVALACADPRQGLQQQVVQRQLRSGAAVASPNHPYLFLTVPRANGNGHEVQGFKVVELEDDDDEEESKTKVENNQEINDGDEDDDDDNVNAANDDDDEDEDVVRSNNVEVSNDDEDEDVFEYNSNDDDDADNQNDENDVTNNLVYLRSRAPHTPRLRSQLKNQGAIISADGNGVNQLNAQLVLKNAKPTNMMVSREHAGAIMVPDGIIEIEGQSVVDEKTGKTALLVPRAALDAIPDGSVVALMERSATDSEEARANRVLVRRRRKGSRRNVVRRRGGNRRRRVGGNRRRRVSNKRKNVRVYQVGGGAKRRRGNRRVARPVVVQG
ncbi:protein zntA [Zeugodacus cucurbitae]|uniref:protein zntA n=1 Tax=Zeugodacus cucurbitae TaxID=28588 RepID=UPI0023D8FA65|nr:protein zntA [Zeugodacus cucurbitae]